MAWLAPLLWLALVLPGSPSDGTFVTSPTAVLEETRWGSSVTVLATYGDTPLRVGDEVLAVGGRAVDEAVRGGEAPAVGPGDQLRYRVLRRGEGLDRELDVEVPLAAHPVWSAAAGQPHRVALTLSLLLAGSLLVWRGARSGPALGTLAAGAAAGVGLTAGPFGPGVVDVATADLARCAVGEVAMVLALVAGSVALVGFALPDGTRVARGARWAAAMVAPAGYAVWLLAYVEGLDGAGRVQAALSASLPAAVAAAALVVASMAVGYRAARDPRDRIALRLLTAVAMATALLVTVLHVVPELLRGEPLVPWRLLGVVVLPLLAACWVVAVQGSRLVELDVLVRRSLVQLVLVTLLGGLFLLAVGAASLTAGASVRSVATGALVVLLLLPVAVVMRRAVSRVAYGERADPDRVVSRLRRLDSAAGPEEAVRETLALLRRSFSLSYIAIEALDPEGADPVRISLGEPRGNPTSVALEVAGQPLGRLDLEVSAMRDPFGPRDRRLLEDLGAQVGALVQALVVNRQLRGARERLVTAREEERRRLRRDLHDGLGPSLASALMRLEVAQELIATDPDKAAELVARSTDQTEAAVAEIRRVVEGLRPPVLDQLGLVAALRAHAADHNRAVAAGRGDRLTWSVTSEDLGRLPAAVEVAAYRIVVEAVTNAIRHSHGSRCEVRLRRAPGGLAVEVRDDGVGFDATAPRGVGMTSMRDRAEELAGTCAVTGSPGGGTLVSAWLPVDGGFEEVP